MNKKTFVVDTNVFLYDPYAIRKFKENDLIIPLSVLEELDKYKKKPNELGKNAREVLRYIDSLASDEKTLAEGITIPEGTTIRIYLDQQEEKNHYFPLPLDRHANQILYVAFNLKQENENVVFVSKDFITRVKAEAMGLEVEDYENLKVSTDNVFQKIRTIHVEKRIIDMFYKDGSVVLEGESFRPNEYCILQSLENSSAVCTYNKKKGRLESLINANKGVWGVHPLNVEQKCVLDLLLRDDVHLISLMGPAGTGKTLLALACGLMKVFDENEYTKILVSRPIIPLGKDIGFLPGTKEEKLQHWMQPIYDNLEVVCQMSNGEANAQSALDFVMSSNKIEVEAVTYIRGRTLPKVYMIIDEAQNLTPHEMKTIISRAGKGTKVILTGDVSQIDNPYLDIDTNGLSYVASCFKDQPIYGQIFLHKTERSELAAIAAEVM
ncbi:MAG TPA: PhoH family protein [Chlamydiales bacterium]|nr:PhoH family protein [Chlamydiales bacterium]